VHNTNVNLGHECYGSKKLNLENLEGLFTILTFIANYEIRHSSFGDECNLVKVRALLHPNVSNDNFPKEIFMTKCSIWWGSIT
jgi:hypothetical protein